MELQKFENHFFHDTNVLTFFCTKKKKLDEIQERKLSYRSIFFSFFFFKLKTLSHVPIIRLILYVTSESFKQNCSNKQFSICQVEIEELI